MNFKVVAAIVLLLSACGSLSAQTINQLPSASGIDPSDYLIVDQVDPTSPTGYRTRKATQGQINANATNVATLNGLVAASNFEIVTAGYFSPNDGGDAAYIGSASACSKSSGAGDGVSQIAGASSTCWLLRDSGDISVKAAGAKCDGSTDDAARIQAALDRTGAGTSTYIPVSTNGCVIKSTIKLNWPYSVLHGLGAGSLVVGGQGSTDPAFLLVDVIATADHSKVANLRIDAKIVSTNVNPTMCALTVTPGNYPIFGQGIFVEADDSVVNDIWGTGTYDNLIGIGRVNCATGTATAGSPQRVNVANIQSVNNGRGSHSGTTHWGGAAVDNLGGGANISNVADQGSNSCAVLDFGDGATGSFNNVWCNSPQVDPAGNGGNCIYAGSANSNFSNIYCLLATGPQALWVDAFASGINFSNVAIAAPAFTGVLIKSATGAGLSPDRISFVNLSMTDVSFPNSNMASGILIDTTAGGGVTNLTIDGFRITDPVGTAYNQYGIARSGSGGLTGWAGKVYIGSGVSGTYSNIPVSFQVDDLTAVANAPTVTSCGTSASVAGNQRSGLITVGSTNPTTACTLNFGFFAWANPANCVFSLFAGTPVALGISARAWTSGGATVTIAAASDVHNQKVSYACN